MVDRTGQIIGNYRIERLLGVGGMGRVFLGSHLHLDRRAAIKIMHAHMAVDSGFQARFVREARSASGLNHPNIVEIYDFGEQDGLFYLVMEPVLDGSMATLLPRQAGSGPALELREGLDLVRQATEGIAYAHARGVIHRDIKPDNLLIKRPEEGVASGLIVKVCDFGLARLVEGSTATATGMMLGTPAYMSPEQCQGLTLDIRSDQYSLGIVLYEVATGRRPFEMRTPTEAMFQHVNTPPPSPLVFRPELPAELSAIIERCLAKRPEDRYPTTDALVAALRNTQIALGGSEPDVVAHAPDPESIEDAASRLLVGRTTQRYQIDALRESGSVTWDYNAHHTGLEYAVIIKALRPDRVADPAVLDRFVREVRLAAAIRHQNLVEVLDTGTIEGLAFVALDAVGGTTLRQLLDQRRLSPDETLRYLKQAAAALDAAHQRGVVTRDVQPGSIIVRDDGTLVLLDVGDLTIAAELRHADQPPGVHRVAYFAPERSTGGPVDSRVDVYALGCLAYELLAGSAPFAIRPAGEHSDPQAGLRLDVPELDPLVSTVIARALSRSPEDRFTSATEFVRVLDAALTDSAQKSSSPTIPLVAEAALISTSPTIAAPLLQPVTVTPPAVTDEIAPPIGPPSSPLQTGAPAPGAPARRVPTWALGIVAVAIVLALGALFWSMLGDDEPPQATATSAGFAGEATATGLGLVVPATSTSTATSVPATATLPAVATASPTERATDTPAPTETPTIAVTPTFDWIAAQRSGLIVFVSGRRPDNQNIPDLYIMNPDGSEQRRLLTFEGADAFPSSGPAFAGDGIRMAVTSSRDGNNEIYTLNIDGTGLTNLTRNLDSDEWADWSPDASSIIFQTTRDGNVEIYQMGASGENPQNLSNTPATDWWPKWSPDGTSILFVSDRNGTNQLFLMTPDGSDQHQLTSEPGAQDYNPSWSPDGGTIAFARNLGDGFHIYLMNADGSNIRQITSGAGEQSTPTWSPDGTRILFRGTVDGNADVYVMNADGSNQLRLTDNPTYDGSPVWAPIPPE